MSTTTSPRSLNTLLGLNTYQGMTDEEIEIILAYKVQQAMIQEQIETKNAILQQEMAQRVAATQAALQQTNNLLQSILNRGTGLTPIVTPQTVQPTSITISDTEE